MELTTLSSQLAQRRKTKVPEGKKATSFGKRCS